MNEGGPTFQPLLWLAAALLTLLSACQSTTAPGRPAAIPEPAPAAETERASAIPPPAVPSPKPVAPVPPAADTRPTPESAGATLRPTPWSEVPHWRDDNPALAWGAFLAGCRTLQNQDAWRSVCAAAAQMRDPKPEAARAFFETHFTPHQTLGPDNTQEGLLTGYYEPLLRGSRKPTPRYRYPVYGVPADLLVIDLAESNPELKGQTMRGRLEGRRIVPYYDRAQIEGGKAAVRGREIAWVDDPIDLFFLQIQGSGRIQLPSGETLRVGYADHNGHPYRSIGRLLVEHGELALEQASMQGIKAWARQNPRKLPGLLNSNARYVFFRELPGDLSGPIGALGVPLTTRRSLAIDPRFVPLGAPVFISTTWPNTTRPLHQLMLAQDTGSAIRGPVRGDFFWGFGDEAGREAGRMKQAVRMWVLLPGSHPLAQSR